MWIDHSLPIGLLIPQLFFFQNLTLKILGVVESGGHIVDRVSNRSSFFFYCFTSIRQFILEMQLFQNLNLKMQGQCNGWGHRWRSHSWPNIQAIHFFFHFTSTEPNISKIRWIKCLTANKHIWNYEKCCENCYFMKAYIIRINDLLIYNTQ